MQPKRFLVFCLIILLLALLSVYYPESTGKTISIEYEKEPAFVIKAIDGDTIETDKGIIRLLGINAPEKNKAYYVEATNFLKQFENKSIEILRDTEDLDRYQRKLRYMFYENRFINIEILEQGLATSFMMQDLKYQDKILRAEKSARTNNLYLWQNSQHKCADCIKLNELNETEESFILQNTCSFNCNLTGWTVKDNANHFIKLKNLDAKETKQYDSKQKIWNNDGDRFFMRDKQGDLVIFYEY